MSSATSSGTTDEESPAGGGEGYSFPEPPTELLEAEKRGNWVKLLKYFGPGAILASMTLGSGEVLFAPRGGAIFGMAILWAYIWAGFVKGIMTYSGSRFYTLTGEHPMSRWAKLPGPRGWFPMLMGYLALIAFPSWAGGLSKMLGQIIAWAFGMPMNNTMFASIGTVMMAVTALLVLVGGYDYVEKAQIAIVAFLSASIAVLAIAAAPDVTNVLWGLVPKVPADYAPWIVNNYPEVAARPTWVEVVTYMGAIGGGIYDYIGFVGYTKEREWGMLNRDDKVEVMGVMRDLSPGERLPLDESEENRIRGGAWLKAPQSDILISFSAITFFTACSMILGALILHPKHLIPSGLKLFQHQALFFTKVHPALAVLWKLGVFFAIFGTLYSMWEGYTWTWLESFKPFSDRVVHLEENRMTLARLITVAYVGGMGLILMWSDISAVAIVTPASIIGGVFGCGLWCWGQLWAEKTALPKTWQGGWKLDLGLIVAGAFLTFSGTLSIISWLGLYHF
ncbi:MAG: Nramp family divalent metal transporter [Halodesulfurarchaeum sp.]